MILSLMVPTPSQEVRLRPILQLQTYLLSQISRKRLTKEIADKTIETLVPK